MLIKGILANIYYRLRIFLLKKQNVFLSKSVRINKCTQFEGKNIAGDHTFLLNTQMGFMSYVGNNCVLNDCRIGRYCSIGDCCEVIAGTHPTKTFVSTHPALYSLDYRFSLVKEQKFTEQVYVDDAQKVKVAIGNDVWIGHGCKILSGVSIGDGAIVAAGALVTKNVEAYSIVGGVPAKEIRKRFSEAERESLLQTQWWQQPEDWVAEHADLLANVSDYTQENTYLCRIND